MNARTSDIPAAQGPRGGMASSGWIAPAWVALAAACAAWAFALYPALPVNRDAGTYLPRALQILDGVAPLVPGYATQTPFSFYILAGWASLFGAGFTQAMLCVYVFHALNGALVACIARRALAGARSAWPIALALGLSYFCAVFLLDGKTLVLEPFLVFFTLLAYLAYAGTRERNGLWRYALAGVFLGCAVMTKQHGAFISVGFAGMVAVDRWRAGRGLVSVGTVSRIALMAVAALIPFFAYVGAMHLGVAEALRLFGIIGGKGAQYAGQKEFLHGLMVIGRKIFQTSWLFVPVIAYCALLAARGGRTSADRVGRGVLWPVMLGCFVPLLVRQFGHYYQYLLPWAFVAWARLARDRDGLDPENILDRDGTLAVVLAAAGAAVGCTLLRVAGRPLSEAGANNLFLAILAVPLALWAVRGGMEFLRVRLAVVLACAMVAVPLVQAANLNPAHYEVRRDAQRELAQVVNRVFPPGSTVLAVGSPELNVTAGFVNPHEYYSWSFYPQQVRDWRSVPNVVVVDAAAHTSFVQGLLDRGFRRLDGPAGSATDSVTDDSNNPDGVTIAYLTNPNVETE